eukprot:353830-Chlamydomonas_euryale.AAC.11
MPGAARCTREVPRVGRGNAQHVGQRHQAWVVGIAKVCEDVHVDGLVAGGCNDEHAGVGQGRDGRQIRLVPS